MLPLLITPANLQQADNANLLIVDVGDAQRYRDAHIPGAVHLDYDRLIVKQPPAMGLFPDSGILSDVFSAIGLRDDLHVVAYDDAGGGKSARLLYTLDCLGHPGGMSWLDGGWAAWQADGGETESGTIAPEASQYLARLREPQRVVDAQKVLAAIDSPETLILDCRSPAEFTGEDVRAAHGGHIPGAVNRNWTETRDDAQQQRLRSLETLKTEYTALGITPEKQIILHCHTHHRSAHTYMLLKALGYENLAGYPGSWSEWGNRDDLPIVTGS